MSQGLDFRDCRNILQTLKDNFMIVQLKDFKQYKDRKDIRVCFLRHDLDKNMDWAIELGELEQEMGIHSTFFVLHTRDYYGKPDFISKCKKLQDMGHEIGLHYNGITPCLNNPNFTPKMVLEKEVKYLRDNGIMVYGLSAHGEDTFKKEVIGYQIFKEFYLPNAKMKYRNVDLYAITLEDFGLYEAYWFLRICPMGYLSDCKSLSLIEQIKNTVKEDKKVCQLLLHPCNHTTLISTKSDQYNSHPHP
jgi:hypothetical protein